MSRDLDGLREQGMRHPRTMVLDPERASETPEKCLKIGPQLMTSIKWPWVWPESSTALAPTPGESNEQLGPPTPGPGLWFSSVASDWSDMHILGP